MTRSIEKQVGRVRRRLFLTSLLANLAWCWLAALGLAAGWFFAQPLLIEGNPDWPRWTVLGSLLAVGAGVAGWLAARSAPSQVSAALSLDEKFGLKERATTALMLDESTAASPVGQALLADAEGRVGGLPVGERFPVRMPRSAAFLPVGALVLVLLALFWAPEFAGKASADDEGPPPGTKNALDDQMKKLAAKLPPKREKVEGPKKEDVDKIDADLEKFTRQPRETREQIKDRIREAQAIEEQIKERQKEDADRKEAFREQMKQLERLKGEDRKERKGPADKLNEAVRHGDMKKAADELNRLADEAKKDEEKKDRLKKKARDPMANEDEKKEAQDELDRLEKGKKDLRDQIEDLENRLKELTRDKEERKKDLDDKAERGEIDKDQLDREKNEIDKNELTEDEKKELKELAEELKECKECMGQEGKEGEAAKKLQKAAGKCDKMGDKEGDGKALAEKLGQVRKVKRALARAAGGGPGVASGRRPESDGGETDKEEKFSPAETTKGRMEITGDGPIGGFKGPRKPEEMAEEIRQAAQDAPAAIDRQRVPAGARKMAKGYFEKVRAADGAKKKE